MENLMSWDSRILCLGPRSSIRTLRQNTLALACFGRISCRVRVTWFSIWIATLRSFGSIQSFRFPFSLHRYTRLLTHCVGSPSLIFALISFQTIVSNSFLISSLRLNGTCLGGWTTGGMLGSRRIWYSPLNFPVPSKHSGYWLITPCLPFMVCSLDTWPAGVDGRFLDREVERQQVQLSGSQMANGCCAWGICGIEGCEGVLFSVITRCGYSAMVFDTGTAVCS